MLDVVSPYGEKPNNMIIFTIKSLYFCKNLLSNQWTMIWMTKQIYCLHLSHWIKTMVPRWLQLSYFASGLPVPRAHSFNQSQPLMAVHIYILLGSGKTDISSFISHHTFHIVFQTDYSSSAFQFFSKKMSLQDIDLLFHQRTGGEIFLQPSLLIASGS